MPSSHTLPLVLAALGSLTAAAHTQNLVTNGDFESGNTNGWTFSGYTVQPQVMPFDTTGTGVSKSFSNRPGSKAKTVPPGGSYTMQQNLLLLPVEHVLFADIAVANTQPLTNVDAGNFEFWADGKLLTRVKLGAIYPNQILRRQVCVRFTPTANAVRPLQIVFSRAWGAQLTTPRHHIDNIILLRLPKKPLVCARGERKVDDNLTIDVYGKPASPFLVFLAATKTNPIAIPGLSGTWSLPLPPQSVPLLTGVFDPQGTARFVIPLPKASVGPIAGVPLHWQGIEVATLTLGTVASFGIYN